MADIVPITTEKPGNTYLTLWEALTTANHTGSGVEFPGASDRSVQVFGTFGGATLILEASLDGGTTWAQMHEPDGTAIAFTGAGIVSVGENSLMIRARLSVVGSGADLDCYLLHRSTMR
ncbi:MAG: hypothetical protein O2884_08630 [Chloroflexi bacterium]|nr:hypothetical protein [Chloroflexota bacterium]